MQQPGLQAWGHLEDCFEDSEEYFVQLCLLSQFVLSIAIAQQ